MTRKGVDGNFNDPVGHARGSIDCPGAWFGDGKTCLEHATDFVPPLGGDNIPGEGDHIPPKRIRHEELDGSSDVVPSESVIKLGKPGHHLLIWFDNLGNHICSVLT
jgi:hypothetical protein